MMLETMSNLVFPWHSASPCCHGEDLSLLLDTRMQESWRTWRMLSGDGSHVKVTLE